MERLQKIIAERGYCSRRKAEKLIVEGLVKVNGTIIKELGYKADEDAKILIADKEIKKVNKKVTYILNKPKGVISSAKDNKGRLTVVDLIPSALRLYPVGRLDYDSCGLIILTNDGELANKIMHPKFELEKIYKVKISGLLSEEHIQLIEKGLELDTYVAKPAQIKIEQVNINKQTTTLLITLHEGHNRQIRKMFAHLNYEVLALKRLAEGPIKLGNLKSGEYRLLKLHELKLLNLALNRVDG